MLSGVSNNNVPVNGTNGFDNNKHCLFMYYVHKLDKWQNKKRHYTFALAELCVVIN